MSNMFPQAWKMYTTVLAHKIPDAYSLLWSQLIIEGLGGRYEKQKYGLLDDELEFYSD
jgi:hypothetical protein